MAKRASWRNTSPRSRALAIDETASWCADGAPLMVGWPRIRRPFRRWLGGANQLRDGGVLFCARRQTAPMFGKYPTPTREKAHFSSNFNGLSEDPLTMQAGCALNGGPFSCYIIVTKEYGPADPCGRCSLAQAHTLALLTPNSARSPCRFGVLCARLSGSFVRMRLNDQDQKNPISTLINS